MTFNHIENEIHWNRNETTRNKCYSEIWVKKSIKTIFIRKVYVFFCRLNNFAIEIRIGLYTKWKTVIELELRWTSCLSVDILVCCLKWNREPSKFNAYRDIRFDRCMNKSSNVRSVRLRITFSNEEKSNNNNTQDDRLTHSELIVNFLNVIHILANTCIQVCCWSAWQSTTIEQKLKAHIKSTRQTHTHKYINIALVHGCKPELPHTHTFC